jgi:hypothetical protein
MPKLRECGRGERHLCQRRQSFVNEPLQPTKRSAFVALGIRVGQQVAERECVGE